MVHGTVSAFSGALPVNERAAHGPVSSESLYDTERNRGGGSLAQIGLPAGMALHRVNAALRARATDISGVMPPSS